MKINGIKREDNLEKEVIDRIVRESHDGESLEINDIDLEVKKAKLAMKQRASSTSDSIEKIYDEEQSKLLRQFSDLEVASSLPNLLNIQSGLYKNRNKNYPPLPKSLVDVL